MFWLNFLFFFVSSFASYAIALKLSRHIAPNWPSSTYPFSYIFHAVLIHAFISIIFAAIVYRYYPERPEIFSNESMQYSDFVTNIAIGMGIFSLISLICSVSFADSYNSKKFHMNIERKKSSSFGREGAKKFAKKRKWWHLI